MNRLRLSLSIICCLMIGTASASATGIAELREDGELIPLDEIPRPGRTAHEPFIPTVRYPDTLFLSQGPARLGSIDIAEFLAAMESDRRLLAELRKSVPQTREEALIYLHRLKQLAERSDPVVLSIQANRVLEQAPIYFDWLETEFEDQADEVYEYYVGGAQGFSRALEEFKNTAMMVAINRIDIASRMIEEAYSREKE